MRLTLAGFLGWGFPPPRGARLSQGVPWVLCPSPFRCAVGGAPAAAGASVCFPRSRHRSVPSVARQGYSAAHAASTQRSSWALTRGSAPGPLKPQGFGFNSAVRFTSCKSLTPWTAARSLTPVSVMCQTVPASSRSSNTSSCIVTSQEVQTVKSEGFGGRPATTVKFTSGHSGAPGLSRILSPRTGQAPGRSSSRTAVQLQWASSPFQTSGFFRVRGPVALGHR